MKKENKCGMKFCELWTHDSTKCNNKAEIYNYLNNNQLKLVLPSTSNHNKGYRKEP